MYSKDPRYWKADNHPYISELKRGSVAHRNGMLQRGDMILFIDNISLRNKTINEIDQLLKSSDEIVKLKIKKDELYTGLLDTFFGKIKNSDLNFFLLLNLEDADEKIVVYTVEMQRNGGPLGITISGSDDLFEPMFVSGLTEGGLAERTSAIHVGDIILAINNVSLRGKSLSEAIELLQNADDMVTLKISRKLEKGTRIEDLANQTKNNFNNQLKNNQQIYGAEAAMYKMPSTEKEDFNNNNNNNNNNSNANHQYCKC